MMNSATSTDQREPDGRGFQTWHFFTLLAMAGATAAVMVSRETHPAALLLLSAAVICAGFVAVAFSHAISGFFHRVPEPAPLPPQTRQVLEREKALVLRSIKELEFDKAMGKVSEKDFADISARLRARAMALMQEMDRSTPVTTKSETPRPAASSSTCAACGVKNDSDARFCKNCGAPMGKART